MNMIELIAVAGSALRRSEVGEAYSARHGVKAADNLTVTSNEIASALSNYLAPRVRGRVVVDVGGGFGLLGLHVAEIAKQVFVIDANPAYAAGWVELLHRSKPANLSFLFGAADEFVGHLRADVALVATHSDVAGMMSIARQLAGEAIDIHGELIAANPEGFDEWARNARLTA